MHTARRALHNAAARFLLRLSDTVARRSDVPNPHAATRAVLGILAAPDCRGADIVDAVQDEMSALGFTWPAPDEYENGATPSAGPAAG